MDKGHGFVLSLLVRIFSPRSRLHLKSLASITAIFEHIYHPLLIFDAETGDLIAALLRAGNRGAAARAVSVLRRIIQILRRRVGDDLEIEIQGDCGFATPELYEYCESDQRLEYTIGLPRNPRLERKVEQLVEKAQADFQNEGIKQRQFTEFTYQADSWEIERRVIAKVEVHEPGLNRRFVVTNR
ncbi:MAG TPA: transposase, partial [Acidobacteriota bacterium]|nr:transposase [Acidobacteriota bacterium]